MKSSTNLSGAITRGHASTDWRLSSSVKSELVEAISPLGAMLEQQQLQSSIDLGAESRAVEVELPKADRSVELALAVGPMYWKHRISDQYTSDLSPFDFNYQDNFGYAARLQASKPLTKILSLELGLDYERVNISSGHNSNIEYTIQNEPGADQVNDYEVSLATPYGLMKTEFTFFRNAEVEDETVALLVDFKNEHLIQNLRIPLSLRVHPLGRYGKLRPVLGAGLGTNYLLELRNAPSSINTNHSAVHYQYGSAVMLDQDIKRWHFDLSLDAGFDITLLDGLDLQLNYQFSKGLSPLFELEKYKTSVDRHYLSLGIRRRF